jgi:enterochelin esterase-like enzyme
LEHDIQSWWPASPAASLANGRSPTVYFMELFMTRLAVLLSFFLGATLVLAKDDYTLGPDSMEKPDVPQGDLSTFKWESTLFKGTSRQVGVYVPKQYDKSAPAAVMVFQDGSGYMNRKGTYRVPVVFDNLIHRKEIPVIVGIFIDPGTFPDKPAVKGKAPSNRSVEYDTLSDQYAKFLESEILPEVGKKVNLTSDPKMRAIGGASSGGICAFTVAWERPDLFTKVLSHIGSFTNIKGGDRYPGMIRKTPKKPIRVFLQDGSNDLDNNNGNWWLSNQQMELALKFKKYDYKALWGDGGHTSKHGGSILPESLRWLWRAEGTN